MGLANSELCHGLSALSEPSAIVCRTGVADFYYYRTLAALQTAPNVSEKKSETVTSRIRDSNLGSSTASPHKRHKPPRFLRPVIPVTSHHIASMRSHFSG